MSTTAASLDGFRTACTLGAFALLSSLLVVSKPRAFFVETDDDETEAVRVRPFGFAEGETLFPLGLAMGVLALLTAFFFAVADMSFSCSRAPPPPP